jgi:cellobiose-specific phosphotransferase system component IIB
MDEVVKKYDVVLLAPHLRAAYEDYEDLFEEAGIPLIQIQQTEYSGTEISSKNLFARVLKEMKLK